MLIVFDEMIAGVESNKKSYCYWIAFIKKETQYFTLSQSYFKVPKTIRLNATHYFIMKIPIKENFRK